jgi:hypothetical protein
MLKISKKAHLNYLARVVKLNNLRKHSNADRLQVETIDGNNVITGLNAMNGMLYVYFPLESVINKHFLSYTNSFVDMTLNFDTGVKGYFNITGRVRATRLRGERSEGYIVPVNDISNWLKTIDVDFDFTEEMVGTEFDSIGNIILCEKYINWKAIKENRQQTKNTQKKAKVSRLVDEQFHFHIDTPQLKKFISNINPNDKIWITRKLHGTSAVISKVLCVKKLNWFEKLLKRLGVNIVDTHYDLVYSSRKVVKNGYLDPKESNHNHYYSSDIWGDCAKRYEQCLKPGISLYGEIVGYTPDGAYIQKGYDYGCNPGEFDFYVYRVTLTSATGDVYEMSPEQMKHYCEKYGIKTVPEFYYGEAELLTGSFFTPYEWENNPYINDGIYYHKPNPEWQSEFLLTLCEQYLEKDCTDSRFLDVVSNQSAPDEGICLRVDKPLDIEVYKLKSFAFLERETKMLDEGDVDMETLQTETEE